MWWTPVQNLAPLDLSPRFDLPASPPRQSPYDQPRSSPVQSSPYSATPAAQPTLQGKTGPYPVSLPHLHQNWAHPCHICTGTGLAAATSAAEQGSPMTTSPPGSGSPLPHLHREWAHPGHICTGIGLTAPTSAHGSSPATSAPGLPPAGVRTSRGGPRYLPYRYG